MVERKVALNLSRHAKNKKRASIDILMRKGRPKKVNPHK